MPGRVNGFTLAYAATGAVVLWSGIKGETISATFRGLLKGQAPSQNQEPITGTGSTAPTGDTGSTASTGATAATGDTGASTTTAAQNQRLAKLLAAPYGWSTGQQWADLVSLWNRESGWNNLAQNPTSTAFGIAQFLDTTWAGVGGSKTSNAKLQITYGLEYIKQRYGSPEAAWAHEVSAGWY